MTTLTFPRGLDSYNAYNVVESLVTLARDYNRTVVFTIHQPRSNIVALFDQLILLAKGHVVYSGPFSKCQHYFERIGFPCPPGFNIADYLSTCINAFSTPSLTLSIVDLTMTASGDTSRQPGTEAASSTHSLHGGQVRPDEEQALQHHDRLGVSAASPGTSGRYDTEPRTQKKSFLSQVPNLVKQTINEVTGASSSHTAAETAEVTLDTLIKAYKESSIAKAVHDEIAAANASLANGTSNRGDVNQTRDIAEESKVLRGRRRASWTTQFRILSGRAFKNLYRDPALLTAHYTASIAIASELVAPFISLIVSHMFHPVICGILVYHVHNDISGFQNRLGFFFFSLALFGFSCLSSLGLFANERILFMRER